MVPIPNQPGHFKLITVMLSEGEWNILTAPILAFVFDQGALSALTPTGCERVEDEFLSAKAGAQRLACSATAIQDTTTGEVFTACGGAYESAEAYMGALQERELRLRRPRERAA